MTKSIRGCIGWAGGLRDEKGAQKNYLGGNRNVPELDCGDCYKCIQLYT